MMFISKKKKDFIKVVKRMGVDSYGCWFIWMIRNGFGSTGVAKIDFGFLFIISCMLRILIIIYFLYICRPNITIYLGHAFNGFNKLVINPKNKCKNNIISYNANSFKMVFFTKHDIKKNTKLCKREIFFMPFFKA